MQKYNMKGIMKQEGQAGITLVALVITVVVMLILAGVAIAAVVDGDGLFSKTRQAAETYENATKEEGEKIQSLINEIDKYLEGNIEEGEETTQDTNPPTIATIESSNIGETTFTLTATGADEESGVAKYEFYLNGVLEKTIETTEGTATYNVTGKTGGQSYKYKVRVYDKVGLYKESSEITVTTVAPIVEPEEVAKIGDFVNYSVVVDGVTYDQWRILDFDNNGHMEIVCYNGPSFTMRGKDDYANAIKILNDESEPYGEGTYGYSTRHLGSDPSNPSSYATISTSYVKYYSNYDSNYNPTTNSEFLEQTHHESDVSAIQSFSNTAEGKKMAGTSWLASRNVNTNSSRSNFHVRNVSSSGSLSSNDLCRVYSDGRENTSSNSYALAPIVSLESGVKINTSTAGNGSEGSPWTLTK